MRFIWTRWLEEQQSPCPLKRSGQRFIYLKEQFDILENPLLLLLLLCFPKTSNYSSKGKPSPSHVNHTFFSRNLIDRWSDLSVSGGVCDAVCMHVCEFLCVKTAFVLQKNTQVLKVFKVCFLRYSYHGCRPTPCTSNGRNSVYLFTVRWCQSICIPVGRVMDGL